MIIDMTEEDVIVEFGNNKNCRIPMKKTGHCRGGEGRPGICITANKKESVVRNARCFFS